MKGEAAVLVGLFAFAGAERNMAFFGDFLEGVRHGRNEEGKSRECNLGSRKKVTFVAG